jgi:hypothetical protein
MPHVSQPLRDPMTGQVPDPFHEMAHEAHRRLTAGAGNTHARIRGLAEFLRELSDTHRVQGQHEGSVRTKQAFGAALAEVRSQLISVLEQAEAGGVGTDPLRAVVGLIQQLEEKCVVPPEEVAVVEAQAVREPAPLVAPSPPQGLTVYRFSMQAGALAVEPEPALSLNTNNCLAWTGDAWKSFPESNVHLPCWVASRTKPKSSVVQR